MVGTFISWFFSSGTHLVCTVQVIPLYGVGQTELGCYSLVRATSPEMAARPYSTLMPLMANHPSPTPLIPSLSGPSCAPPIHWQISGLDGATANALAAETVSSLFVQDPEHQLDG
jgi:hypothetical protein